ncbi:MAG: C-GCAxxG-C-C family protein [Ignavibacteriales bacterium]|nr:C-GCAxxG-C-C family protein [Ignavibacteriales bacterium]
MGKSEIAIECFQNGFSCSQAVISTYCEELGLDKESALKIACAFGGGMGHIGETCGAVTGAFMVIGLKHGKIKVDDNEAKAKTYELVAEFAKRFKALNNSIHCFELIGFDLSTEEGLAQARESNRFKTVCPKLVKDAAEIVEELLQLKA